MKMREITFMYHSFIRQSVSVLLLASILMLLGCSSVPKTNPETFSGTQSKEAKLSSGASMDSSVDFLGRLTSGEPEPYLLGPGDILGFDLIHDNLGPAYIPVGPDGRIYFDLIDGQLVTGLTVEQARIQIEEQISRYLKNPQIALTLHEANSKTYTILGRVMIPGVYPLDHPTTLLESIAKARSLAYSQDTGTTEDLANLQKSFVMRDGEILPIDFEELINKGQTKYNVYLRDGDFIYFPSALSTEVYVLGAVLVPKGVSFKKQITLGRALATAGGPIPGAHVKQIVVIRGSLTKPEVGVFNLHDILSGKISDVHLESGDIVYVPDHPLRKLKDLAWFAVGTFARTVAANEGSKLASDEPDPVGLQLGVGL